jgi:predicted GIY-YIG superfamily endonuclease
MFDGTHLQPNRRSDGIRLLRRHGAVRLDAASPTIAAARQVKGWSRAKKEALIRGDFEALKVARGTAAIGDIECPRK